MAVCVLTINHVLCKEVEVNMTMRGIEKVPWMEKKFTIGSSLGELFQCPVHEHNLRCQQKEVRVGAKETRPEKPENY